MQTKKIGKYSFELDTETSRIVVYEEGQGVDPVSYIKVKSNITEKDFDYEIMGWVVDNKKL